MRQSCKNMEKPLKNICEKQRNKKYDMKNIYDKYDHVQHMKMLNKRVQYKKYHMKNIYDLNVK